MTAGTHSRGTRGSYAGAHRHVERKRRTNRIGLMKVTYLEFVRRSIAAPGRPCRGVQYCSPQASTTGAWCRLRLELIARLTQHRQPAGITNSILTLLHTNKHQTHQTL